MWTELRRRIRSLWNRIRGRTTVVSIEPLSDLDGYYVAWLLLPEYVPGGGVMHGPYTITGYDARTRTITITDVRLPDGP